MGEDIETVRGVAFEGLNYEQEQVVVHEEGPLLVLSGAGTGKTRVLTSRIAQLVSQGRCAPWQILAVTFTNKAAREIGERLRVLLGEDAFFPWCGTFHALCAKMLRIHAPLVGLTSHFSILAPDDQLRLVKRLFQEERVDEKRWIPGVFVALLDRWKNKALAPDDVPPEDINFAQGRAQELYRRYQEMLLALNAVDFGDLILSALGLLKTHPDVREEYRERFQYILVDEYQDTNRAQYLFLKALVNERQNICCVGDDDQAIYTWRGAHVDHILGFTKDFPTAKVVKLERNYRSSAHILGAAATLIARNKKRLDKTLQAQESRSHEDEAKVCLVRCDNEEDEALKIAHKLKELEASGENVGSMAILVRASFQMRALEEGMATHGIPYTVVGGLRFYERAEIKDANAYLRIILQEEDDLAFERILNTPRRGLGDKSLEMIRGLAQAHSFSYARAARSLVYQDLPHAPALSTRARKSLQDFLSLLEVWRSLRNTLPLDQVLERVLRDVGYKEYLRSKDAIQAQARFENLEELLKTLASFEDPVEYLEHIALVNEMESGLDAQASVSLMTLHSAKGLEFDIVFLPGWEEGVFPHQRALEEGRATSSWRGLEEERRLAYVGLTRARRRVFIFFAASRRIYGSWSWQRPSRFLSELSPLHIVHAKGLGSPTQGHGSQEYEGSFDERLWGLKRAQTSAPHAHYTQTSQEDRTLTQGHQLRKGQRVSHATFGVGILLDIDADRLTVAFEGGRSIKKLLARFVKGKV